MNLGFIGTGNIVSDVITGINKSKFSYKKIIISPRNKRKASYLKKKFKRIMIAENNQAVIDRSDWVFLGVLPQVGENILPRLNFKKTQIVISFMSTTNYSKLKKLIKKKVTIIRASSANAEYSEVTYFWGSNLFVFFLINQFDKTFNNS